MKRGAFGSLVPSKKRKTSALPESLQDDALEGACEDGEADPDEQAQDGEVAPDVDEEVIPDEEAAPDDEAAAASEENFEIEDVQDEDGQDKEDAPDQDEPVEGEAAEDDEEHVENSAVRDEESQNEEEAPDEGADDNQVAVEQELMQDEDVVADDDIAFEEEALAEDATAEAALPDVEAEFDEEGVPDCVECHSNDKTAPGGRETELNELPDAAQAEMDELAKLAKEVELAKQTVQDEDCDDAPAPDYLQDQPDSDSSDSDSSDSTSASSGKAVAAISDGSSLLDLLGSGSNPPLADAAYVPVVQDEEAEGSSPAELLEQKLTGDLAKLGPKKRAARLAQLSKWLWERLRLSSLPSGLDDVHEVEALILRLAGEPGEDVPQPSTPPRKVQHKSGGVARRPCAEPRHREPEQEPLWPILSEHPQHHGLSARFAKKKALCEITPVQSFREEDLWFQNPGQFVSCDWCGNEVPQSFGNLQGAEGQSTFSQCEFVCFTCIGEYGCGE